MSRKRKNKQAVPEEILAEGSEGTPVHVQADEAGTELHVSADEVAEAVVVAEAADVIDEPAPTPKSRKGRKAARAVPDDEDVQAIAHEDVASAAPVEGEGAETVADAVSEAMAADDRGVPDDPAALAADGEALAGEESPEELAADGEELAADGEELAADGEELAADGEELAADGEELAAVMPTSAAALDAGTLKHLVEALVFAADKPITVQRLRQLTRVADIGRLEVALAELAVDYQDRGVILQQVSGGYQFRTQTRFSAWVQQLIQGRPVRLSRAQLETLAIVAYRQPITRPEIDDIRGVDSSATLKLLLDRALIRILGKREEVGRPMLYGTTKEFLDFFSLGDLRELPTLREYSELTDESRKVMKDRLGGGDPEGGSTPSSEDGGAPPANDGGAPPDSPTASAVADADDASEHATAGDDASEHATAGDDAIERGSADAGAQMSATSDVTEDHAAVDEPSEGEPGEPAWPHGSVRMAAVTPSIELEPKPEEDAVDAVDAHVAAVLEGVAPDSGGPIQE